MNELVGRLRARKGFFRNGATWCMGNFPDDDCEKAADEIERLRTALTEITSLCKTDPVNPFLANNMDRIARGALNS